jgi:hypothetical protein
MNETHVSWWQRQAEQRQKAHTDEGRRRIVQFGRLLSQLEKIVFEDHLAPPITALRKSYAEASAALSEGTVGLCRSLDCLNLGRGGRSRREAYCSDKCYARQRGMESRERRRRKTMVVLRQSKMRARP